MAAPDSMTAATITTTSGSAASFALDARGLAALQAKAKGAPDKALKQAATQFEAVFMNMLLKSMRETIPNDGMLDSDTTRTYTSMFDQQLAQSLSGHGVGLADMIVKQLSRGLQAGQAGPGAVPRAADGTQLPEAPVDQPAGSVTQPTGGPAAQASEFLRSMLPHAKAAEAATGIPARFVLAQAALESGWGRHEVRGADGSASRNIFGIKAGPNWKGPVVEAATTEYVNGEPRRVVERFRAYDSYAQSFADYARLLTSSPRYRDVLAQAGDARGFANALQQAGYATDPRYAEKIGRIIQSSFPGAVA